jgi:Mg-chelatase subunit ChlD
MALPPKSDDISADILELLKNQHIQAPDQQRKEDTIFRATELFSEKIANPAQEKGVLGRLFGIRGNKARNQRGYFMKKRHIMMASVATIAMLAIIMPQIKNHQAYNGAQLMETFSRSDSEKYSTTQSSPSGAPSDKNGQLSDMLINTQRNESSPPAFLGPLGYVLEKTFDRSGEDRDPFDNQATLQADKFSNRPDQQMQDVASQPVSTFSADVDTASYSTVRKYLMAGAMPPPEAVRTEELVNYFNYNYPTPDSTDKLAFTATTSVLPNPWNKASKLVHIGIKGTAPAVRPAANIVLLIDVSGSMNSADKLPLVQQSFMMLLDRLDEQDTVSIVTYAGQSAVKLPPTSASNKELIRSALTMLYAGGGTAGADGINTAYRLARENFKDGGINRIFLATDGDFNLGVSSPGELASMVSREKESGIFLSVLGFGMTQGYNDRMMQGLAQNGNGVASYIDNISEAKRVLVDNLNANLYTIAKDVKLQVEFDPAKVGSYRLLGYETRALKNEDFDNDKVDSGDIGSGHEVTAIYEIMPKTDLASLEPGDSVAELRIRYKAPDDILSTKITHKITIDPALVSDITKANEDSRFAVAVAGFSRLLRKSEGMSGFSMPQVYELAKGATGEDADNSRHEFLTMVNMAISLGLGREVVPMDQGGVAFPP